MTLAYAACSSSNDLIKAVFNFMQFTAPSEQQTVTTPTQVTGNGSSSVAKSNGTGKVLHRVIALTAGNHGDGNQAGKGTPKPAYVPEKLQFSEYEKFEGESRV